MLRIMRGRSRYAKHAIIVLAVAATVVGAQHAAPLQKAADAPQRPRITGIDHVRLYVSDIEKSKEFYGKYVGLRTKAEGACRTAVYPCFPINPGEQIELEAVPSPAPKNWLAEVTYSTDNLDQMRSYLLAHKVETTPITTDLNRARHFEVRDPEGNPVAFVQRASGFSEWLTGGSQVGTRLFHAGWVVRNVATENKFYRDLLGFKLYWQGGFKDDGLDWYEIQVPDGDNWIEYMLNIPANADHKELGVQNHFSLGVNDIHAAAEQIRKNGLAKFDGPEIGRDGKWALDAYDPDGTRVEFMEFTPAKEPCCHPYTAPHPKP